MINIQDPYGLIGQMFPKFWGPIKRKEIAALPRINQIQEVLRYRKVEGQYKELDEEKLRQALKHVRMTGMYEVEPAGEQWFRVKAGKHSFYTDGVGLGQLEKIKEGIREGTTPLSGKE
jgi:hypothetical protein